MQENIFLSIIIPAYNEEVNIGYTLDEIAEYLKGKEYSHEIILIDDGSSDDTIRRAEEKKGILKTLRIVESKPNRGKGYVVREAVLSATGKYVMFMDADNSTSIKEMDKFMPYLEEGYDSVIGSRRLKDSEIAMRESALRIIMGQFYIFLSKLILGIGVKDVNCGFKAYQKDTAKKIFGLQRSRDWSFDSELLFLLAKNKMRVKEVPVRWEHHDETSKVKPFKAAVESFLSLVTIKMNDFKGRYRS